MFSNLQIRPAKPHRRRPSMAARAGISKRRISIVPVSTSNNVPALSFMEGLFGEEFPEAFASGELRPGKSKKSILDLPAELLTVICDYMSKVDIKRLRLTSKKLALNVDLRIDRVYISPNRANLGSLQRILQHPRYRNRVHEIVWDDAQLQEYPTLDSFRNVVDMDERRMRTVVESRLDESIWGCDDDSPDYHSLELDDFFTNDGRLTEVAKGLLLRDNDQFSRDIIARNATTMSTEDSYLLYQRLYQEEQDIIKRQVDVAALQRALGDFPSLRRITLTSEVWRPWNLYPNYDTPFYRSLPPGFRKPSVFPWTGYRPQATIAQPAHPHKILSERGMDSLASDWRGYSIIVAALLNTSNSQIDEFIIDAGNESIGISHQLFASPNSDYSNTVRMFRHLHLKRLKLVINSQSSGSGPDSIHSSGLLKRALHEARHLEHFEFDPHWRARSHQYGVRASFFDPMHFLPENLLSRLRTFALRNVQVEENKLQYMLEDMVSVEQVTLDNIGLTGDEGSWFHFFNRLKLYYATSPMVSRPNFEWKKPFEDEDDDNFNYKRCYLVDGQLVAFLYENADCPFEYEGGQQLGFNMGWVVDDWDKSYRVKRIW
ncbi:hypothetical protein BKA66DRAFT_407303 [Pyrenochaeta sp. MPI-SDFR-AT-0127]|nr:hypothetical protein BKA66DRAFT_407303 [Pyrenochaeta sp. MPI-SDFR-AT-0127]